ncbi:MAG: hypothetical protein PVJ76_21935 [Gemmatimonadota bacterium]|jgi:hypothetical protein
MDNQDTNEDYRAASIPEAIVLIDKDITGNGRDLSTGSNTNPSGQRK